MSKRSRSTIKFDPLTKSDVKIEKIEATDEFKATKITKNAVPIPEIKQEPEVNFELIEKISQPTPSPPKTRRSQTIINKTHENPPKKVITTRKIVIATLSQNLKGKKPLKLLVKTSDLEKFTKSYIGSLQHDSIVSITDDVEEKPAVPKPVVRKDPKAVPKPQVTKDPEPPRPPRKVLTHRPSKNPPTTIFKCNYCPQLFSCKDDAFYEHAEGHITTKFTCELCDAKYYQEMSFANHKCVQCKICKQHFQTQKILQMHTEVEH